MSSAQLYKQWHLHISATDNKWLYLDCGLDMLARFSSESRQPFWGRVQVIFYANSSRGYTDTNFTVYAQNTATETIYGVKETRAGNMACQLFQHTLTKDQIWRRLASAPGPEDWTSQVVFKSQASLSPHDFACAAQQSFSLLCLRRGFLQFYTEAELTPRLDTPCTSLYSHSCITFGVIPQNRLAVSDCTSAPNSNSPCWTYEGKWSTCLPDLQFDRFALRYTLVELVFVEN